MTNSIDLVKSDNEDIPTESSKVRLYPMTNNRYKVTAGRPQHNFNENVKEVSLDEGFTTHQGIQEQDDDIKTDQDTDFAGHQVHEKGNSHAEVPPQKIKITKFKRKKDNDSLIEVPKKKKAGLIYPNLKFTTTDDQKLEGATHLNKEKEEVKLRNSPRLFSEMVYYLTEDQRRWVTKSGFGPLLDFDLEMLPTKISYNILQIFDHQTLSLKLKNGEINITEQDVYDVLGLPCAGLPITLVQDDKYKERFDKWSKQFLTDKEKEQVTPQKLVQLMRHQGVTDNFKLNFLIVMSNVLVGTTSWSYVDKQLLKIDDDLDSLHKYNWSEYLLYYLVAGLESWNRTASTVFRGSLIFLTLLYVDRVRHKGIKLVERKFPSYIGWTEDRLKERQILELRYGVFGVGSIVPPLRNEIHGTNASQFTRKEDSNDDWDDWEVWQKVDEMAEMYNLNQKSPSAEIPKDSSPKDDPNCTFNENLQDNTQQENETEVEPPTEREQLFD